MFCCVKPPLRYKDLLDEVFPNHAPSLSDPVSDDVKRKIQKLGEYVNNNPDYTQKVSKELQSKIKGCLKVPADHGHIRIAVYCYSYMLLASQKEGSRYDSSYFRDELLKGQTALIPTLLKHDKSEVRALGTDLFAVYVKVQDGVEGMDQIEVLIPALCEVSSSSRIGSQKGQAAVAAPAAERLAGLIAMQEFMLLCLRAKAMPKHLNAIMMCILDGVSLQQPAYNTPVQQPDHAGDVAKGILALLGQFMSDIGNVQRVIHAMLNYLTHRHQWGNAALVQDVMHLLRSASPDKHFLLYTTLCEHACDSGLTIEETAVVVTLACQEGLVQRAALPALSTALQKFPLAYAAAANRKGSSVPDMERLKALMISGVQRLAVKVGDAAQLCESIGSALRWAQDKNEQAVLVLECGVAAIQALHQLGPEERKLAGARLPTSILQPLLVCLVQWAPLCRSYAFTILLTLLQYNPSGIADDSSAEMLLRTMWAQLALPDSLPGHLEAMCALLQACIVAASTTTLLLIVRFILFMERDAVQLQSHRLAPIGMIRACGVLEMVNCLLLSLASACGLPDLTHNLLPVENSCPALKVKGGRLVAVPEHPSFDMSPSEYTKAMLNILDRKLPFQDWAAKICHNMSLIPALREEYGDMLGTVLMTPFDQLMSEATAGDTDSHHSGNKREAMEGKMLVDKIQGQFNRADSVLNDSKAPVPRLADIAADDSFSSQATFGISRSFLESGTSVNVAGREVSGNARLLKALQLTATSNNASVARLSRVTE